MRKVIIGVVLLFLIYGISFVVAQADPLDLVNTTFFNYTFRKTFNNSFPSLQGADAFNEGNDFALIDWVGNVKFYHENVTSSTFVPYLTFLADCTVYDPAGCSGISEVPADIYPGQIVVSDTIGGILFYDWNGNLVERRVMNGFGSFQIRDISYDWERDLFLVLHNADSGVDGYTWYNLSNNVTSQYYVCSGCAQNAPEVNDMGELPNGTKLYNMIHRGQDTSQVAYLESYYQNGTRKRQMTTTWNCLFTAMPTQGIAYTKNHVVLAKYCPGCSPAPISIACIYPKTSFHDYIIFQYQINSPPVLNMIGNRTVNATNNLSIQLGAFDADNDTLTFGVDASEISNFSFNSLTGLFEWHTEYENVGNYNLTFNVSDGEFWDSETINVEVVNPFCSDSDGGRNFNVRGTTVENTVLFGQDISDFCYDYTNFTPCEGGGTCELVEHSCKTYWHWEYGWLLKEKYSCPFGCLNGACIPGRNSKKMFEEGKEFYNAVF